MVIHSRTFGKVLIIFRSGEILQIASLFPVALFHLKSLSVYSLQKIKQKQKQKNTAEKKKKKIKILLWLCTPNADN